MTVLAMSDCFKPFIKKLNSYLQLAATYLLHIDWSFFLGPSCADCDVAKSANDSTSKLLIRKPFANKYISQAHGASTAGLLQSIH